VREGDLMIPGLGADAGARVGGAERGSICVVRDSVLGFNLDLALDLMDFKIKWLSKATNSSTINIMELFFIKLFLTKVISLNLWAAMNQGCIFDTVFSNFCVSLFSLEYVKRKHKVYAKFKYSKIFYVKRGHVLY
jgi:hypothetical protein